jgi:hypothetical protein
MELVLKINFDFILPSTPRSSQCTAVVYSPETSFNLVFSQCYVIQDKVGRHARALSISSSKFVMLHASIRFKRSIIPIPGSVYIFD